MKYFLDTEFIEGFNSSWFRRPKHFIDLISIGIYREDGGQFSAISCEYSFESASEWVKENVIIPLYSHEVSGDMRNHLTARNFHHHVGDTLSQIREDLLQYFECWKDQDFWCAPDGIEVYGYFADYDWVLFCSLFGKMIDLPKGFPMYCKDLKQMMDERGLDKQWKDHYCPESSTHQHDALYDARWNFKLYNQLMQYDFLNNK